MTDHYTSVKPLFHFPGMCRVERSLDGFLLKKAFVANPLTGSFSLCPPTRNKTLWPTRRAYVKLNFGPGFASSVEKYKVVYAYFGDIDSDNKRWRTGAQVYTVGTTASSSWVDILSQPAVPIHYHKHDVYASGALHWMVDYELGAKIWRQWYLL